VREDGRWKFGSLGVFGLTDTELNALRGEVRRREGRRGPQAPRRLTRVTPA
jgi:hypothetical protein